MNKFSDAPTKTKPRTAKSMFKPISRRPVSDLFTHVMMPWKQQSLKKGKLSSFRPNINCLNTPNIVKKNSDNIVSPSIQMNMVHQTIIQRDGLRRYSDYVSNAKRPTSIAR
jgi:hypothetical protein